MTISQQQRTSRRRSVSIALPTLLFTTLSLLPIHSSADPAPVVGTTKSNTLAANLHQPSISNLVSANSSTTAPLSQPTMSDPAMLEWASGAAKSVYSYDFKNYANQIAHNQQNFTPDGWQSFTSALDKSKNLIAVQNKKLVASASLTGKPRILKKGVQNGAYFWHVQVPLLATYESESKLIKQNLLVDMLIVRTHTPKGVGISHFVAAVVPANQLATAEANMMTSPATVTSPPLDNTLPVAPSTPNSYGPPSSSMPNNYNSVPSTAPDSMTTPPPPATITAPAPTTMPESTTTPPSTTTMPSSPTTDTPASVTNPEPVLTPDTGARRPAGPMGVPNSTVSTPPPSSY